VRLEPSQVAGFLQAFRSIIPRSGRRLNCGRALRDFRLRAGTKIKTGTYLGIEGGLLNSEVDRIIGVVDLDFPPAFVPSGTRQNLDYTEKISLSPSTNS